MAAKKIQQGKQICQAGQEMDAFYVIASGSVRADFSDDEFILGKGNILGIQDALYGTCSSTCTALEDTVLLPYPFKGTDSLTDFFRSNPDLCSLFLTATLNFTCMILDHYVLLSYDCSHVYERFTKDYEEYRELCKKLSISPKALPGMDTLEPLSLEEDIPSWVPGYYEGLRDLDGEGKTVLYSDAHIITGFFLKACEDIHTVLNVCHMMNEYLADISGLLLNDNHLDFFDLYTNLYFKMLQSQDDAVSLSAKVGKLMIEIEGMRSIDKSLYTVRMQEYKNRLSMASQNSDTEDTPAQAVVTRLSDSVQAILEYGKCSMELSQRFTELIADYQNVLDKNDASDSVRNLRNALSSSFYQVYMDVFRVSITDSNIPIVIKMFLSFGFVDARLAGPENAAYLFSLAENLRGAQNYGVYTFYEWLQAIYYGEKEPSRNEFDADYSAYLHSQKTAGKITAQDEQRLLDDPEQKVIFELQNMFPPVNKMTFGRITTFCPVFSEHNVLKDLSSILVSAEKVVDSLHTIRTIDYSAYFRETIYTNEACGIPREFIQIEILPDIILMPCIGTRGVMWQEIEGRRRTTPSRMMLPIFSLEDVQAILTRLTGEYRWEMCKRIQGARWNDMSERSLTSEYVDYIQFYKKNHDLSSDAKDKIKNALMKSKNNFKEMFVRDYVTWITFEGKGSPRLNKIARSILFSYCPFSKSVRDALKNNPLYKDTMERYNLKTSQKLHHLNTVCAKIQKNGATVPDTLVRQRRFLES